MAFLTQAANRGSISTEYDIDNSVKLEDDNDEFLTRTNASGTNRKTWTVSVWFKQTELASMRNSYTEIWDGGVFGEGTRMGMDNTDRFWIDIGGGTGNTGTNYRNFSTLKLDLKGIYYIPRIIKASKLGDAAILKEIIKIFAQNKIKTENSLKFNPELSLTKGNYSKIKPNKQDQLDIKIAIKTLNNLRQYNFSQAVVVRNKKVISIEGKGGTKKMLEKSKSKIFRNHGLLVK